MNYFISGLLLLFTSCSIIKPIDNLNKEKASSLNINEPLVNSVTDVLLYPGKVTYVEFPINLKNGRENLQCKNRNVPFFVKNKIAKLYLSESYFSDLNEYKCYYKLSNAQDTTNESRELILHVKLKAFNYKSERLYVDKRRVTLSKEDQLRVEREREITKKIYQNTASFYLFDGPFYSPLKSYITSHYGTRRLFNNKKKSSHLGNDFRAAIGVPIPVSNRGRVVFTGNLFYSGNVVIVDHGMDIFTLYGHLSKIKVTTGTVVNRGDILGLSGRTGRVSGPHLHWGVRLNGNAVDGFSLIEASRSQFGPSLSQRQTQNQNQNQTSYGYQAPN